MTTATNLRDMTWSSLLVRCRKDALWAANKLTVMDKRLEEMEAQLFNHRHQCRSAATQMVDLDHSLAALERALKLHLAKRSRPTNPTDGMKL